MHENHVHGREGLDAMFGSSAVPPFLGSATSFSSVTDPTLHRREWRSTSARDPPALSPRQIPSRYRGALRYDRLSDDAHAIFSSPPRHARYSTSMVPSPATSPKEPRSDDDVPNAKINLEELKWFVHRWLDKHGKNSQLKEFREKMTLMRRWFESLDADGSGEVGLNELEDPLVSVGLARSREDVQKLIDDVDKEGKGEVTFDEFLNLMYPKKVKRSRQREPLHQPKTRVIVEAQLTNATQSKAGLPRQPTTPFSSPRGPSSPQGYNAGVISSPRGSPQRVVSCHSSARTEKPEPKVNPVVKLFEDLQSGKLGDLAIPFPVLITAYRRRMLLNAHMADDPTARRIGTSVLNALESSRREIGAAQQEHNHSQQSHRSDSIGSTATHVFLRRRSSTSLSPVSPSKPLSGNRRQSVVKGQLQQDNKNKQMQLPTLG